MNLRMWEIELLKNNIRLLKDYGVSIYPANISESYELASKTFKKNVSSQLNHIKFWNLFEIRI